MIRLIEKEEEIRELFWNFNDYYQHIGRKARSVKRIEILINR